MCRWWNGFRHPRGRKYDVREARAEPAPPRWNGRSAHVFGCAQGAVSASSSQLALFELLGDVICRSRRQGHDRKGWILF